LIRVTVLPEVPHGSAGSHLYLTASALHVTLPDVIHPKSEIERAGPYPIFRIKVPGVGQ